MSETEVETTYQRAVRERDETQKAIVEHERQTAKDRAELKAILRRHERIIEVAESGFDPDNFVIARDILHINWAREKGPNQRYGDYPRTGPHRDTAEVRSAIRDTMEDLRHGGQYMRTGYYGVKQYDGWASQRSDHPYGYGPSHGSVWFEVGLKVLRRKTELTQDEVIACLAWLSALLNDPERVG